MADEADNTAATAGTEARGWPEIAYPEEPDAVDALIEALNAATGGALTFERDVLDVDRPEDWGAVELIQAPSLYADGEACETIYTVDIWACVSDRSSDWKDTIEGVLAAQGDRMAYRMKERYYLHNVKKVMWRWSGTLIGLEADGGSGAG